MPINKELCIKLVETVEMWPCLYNHSIKEYSNERAKSNAWEAVANEIKLSVSTCKEKWHNIRGRYLRQLKETQPSGSGVKAKQNYYLNEYLNFLEPFTTSRTQTRNLTKYEEGIGDKVDIDKSEDEEEQYCEDEDDIQSSETTSIVNKRKCSTLNNPKKKRDGGYALEELNKAAAGYFKNKSELKTLQLENDPDLNFLKSILPDIKTLENKTKRKLKMKILQAVDDACQESQAEN